MPGLALTNATLVRSGMIKSFEVACARHLFGVPAQDRLGGPSEMGVCSRVSSRSRECGYGDVSALLDVGSAAPD